MNGRDIKETMEQLHIPKEMQRQIIANVRERTAHGRSRAVTQETGVCGTEKQKADSRKIKYWNKRAVTAAALVLAAGIIAIPVKAVVQNIVKARMEGIPEEEVHELANFIQKQDAEADSFSREYSDWETARMKELLQAYQDGAFPEKTILQVDTEAEAPEGELCFVRDKVLFCLPERELTDEELLEIIDFNRTRNYALSQTQAAKEAQKEYLEERRLLQEQIQEAGGISQAEAVEIAKKQLEAELGASAGEKAEIHVGYIDISDAGYEHKGDLAYEMIFSKPGDGIIYTCLIDSQDGKVLNEAQKEYLEKQGRLEEQILEAGGISEAEAVEIAKKQLEAELGASVAENAEIYVGYTDTSDAAYESKADMAYMMIFCKPEDGTTIYTCIIDAQDGRILESEVYGH